MSGQSFGEHVLAGIAGVIAGLVPFAWPGPTGEVLVLFAGAWLVAETPALA